MSPDSAGGMTAIEERDSGGNESKRGAFIRKISSGELGSLRVLIVLVVIWAIFQIANDRFLTSINLENLMLQITAVAVISIGVVMILLLGEIDLSVGAVSGLAAGVMAVLTVKHGVSPILGILAGLAVGASIGCFNGIMVTQFGVPSFVVTLAGLLGWQGVLLWVLGDTGTINLPESTITIELDGEVYLGFMIRHAGSVRLNPSGSEHANASAAIPGGHLLVVMALALLAGSWRWRSNRPVKGEC